MGGRHSKLFDRIECKDVEGAKKILDKHPDLLNDPIAKGNGYSFLSRAVWREDITMVKMMHKLGANLNLSGNIFLVNISK